MDKPVPDVVAVAAFLFFLIIIAAGVVERYCPPP